MCAALWCPVCTSLQSCYDVINEYFKEWVLYDERKCIIMFNVISMCVEMLRQQDCVCVCKNNVRGSPLRHF